MASVRTRENTFKVPLSTFPKRPTFEEMHVFVYQTLGLRLDQVLRLQMNHAQNCVHVKCVDLKTAQDIVMQNDGKHELEVNKKKYKVRLQMDDGGVEIKVHDLSENVTKAEIVAALQQYGDVINAREQIWGEGFVGKGTSSGVWVIKMNLRRHIKSFITIQGEQTLVTYRNQPQTCRHCMNLSHPGSTCVENKRLIAQRVDLEGRLKRIQGSSASGSSSQMNTGSQSPSFAAVLSNEAPIVSTSSFTQFIPSSEECTSDSPIQQQDQQITPSEVPSLPDTPSTIVPTTSGAAASSIVELGEHDEEMESGGTNTATVDQHQKGASGEQITPKLQTSVVVDNDEPNDERTTSSGKIFKTPAIPSQSRTSVKQAQAAFPSLPSRSMEISESDSNDSASENNPYQIVKRGRGRQKKQRTDSPHSQTIH